MQRRASLVLLAALLAAACSGSLTEPTETHDPEGTGGEAGESGTRYGPGDEARELRGGVEPVMRFERRALRHGAEHDESDRPGRAGRDSPLKRVELGPTTRVDLGTGVTIRVPFASSSTVAFTIKVMSADECSLGSLPADARPVGARREGFQSPYGKCGGTLPL